MVRLDCLTSKTMFYKIPAVGVKPKKPPKINNPNVPTDKMREIEKLSEIFKIVQKSL